MVLLVASTSSNRDDTPDSSPESPDESPTGGDSDPGVMAGLHIGYTMLAAVLVGLGIGYLIDEFAGTSPWGKVVSSMLFIVAGLYQSLREFIK